MKKLRKRSPRLVRRLIPFKGQFAWEVQVGPVVLQWRHDGKGWHNSRGLTCGNLSMWRDTEWAR